ncbi:MAG: hydroxymethylglutaryl-CoA lyase [Sphingobacteriales bacterium]|nr:MAG: hydroxymethylglutaryl-CoA lyase [Sphingobacteriales bacterium]
MLTPIKLIECPRDAMQGIHHFIPTELKVKYLNALLKVGFDTLDFGSFVSPKAIPQLRDTAEVLAGLELNTNTKLLAIIANTRGAENAMKFPEIDQVGFPFSISETFQLRNTNSGIEDSLITVENILNLCDQHNKEAVIYLSMGFGNPYGDLWNTEIVAKWADRLISIGARILSVADTTGSSTDISIREIMPVLIKKYPDTEIGVHLHSKPDESISKINAAFESGCRRFDSALLGFGGCPMADDNLTGNIATETLVHALEQKTGSLGIDKVAFEFAQKMASGIFL